MARTKGSKNKPKTETALSVEQLNEQISAVEAEIAALNGQLKAKKAQLKALTRDRDAAAAAAAKAQEAEQKARLLEAVKASGKSYDEVIALLSSK